MKRMCVFCGSRTGAAAIYADAARCLGEALVRRGLELVFGGGHIGLMGVLADAVLAGGGKVIGVIPQALVDKELAHRGCTQLHVVKTMHERKAVMADLSDGFIALPGAFGTADEFFEILTWAQLGIHTKPAGLLNVAGFFSPLLSWLDLAAREGFLKAEHRSLIVEANDVVLLLSLLAEYGAPAVAAKWAQETER
jgi:uncharacterized protein (TIGR00730 family)